MQTCECDIAVIGGGLSGLVAASVFAARGFDVVNCCEFDPKVGTSDNRVTAFLNPSIEVLNEAVDWPAVSMHSRPLTVMRIVDAGAETSTGISTRDFRAGMIGERCFGYAVPNNVLVDQLTKRITEMPNVKILTGASAVGFTERLANVVVRLADGKRVVGRLAVAADGRDSLLRKAAGISTKHFGFGQKALSFNVAHEQPHNDETIEIHASGGPFTLVPIEDIDEKHASAVAWMDDGTKASRLVKLSVSEFEAEANRRSLGVRGRLSLAGPRRIWPVFGQVARRFSSARLALIGEAAHVVPPVGAQGLNMTMADISALAALASSNVTSLGSYDMMEHYDRKRRFSVAVRLSGVMALDWISSVKWDWLRELRRRGLTSLVSAPAIREPLMRFGMRTDAPLASISWGCIRKDNSY